MSLRVQTIQLAIHFLERHQSFDKMVKTRSCNRIRRRIVSQTKVQTRLSTMVTWLLRNSEEPQQDTQKPCALCRNINFKPKPSGQMQYFPLGRIWCCGSIVPCGRRPHTALRGHFRKKATSSLSLAWPVPNDSEMTPQPCCIPYIQNCLSMRRQ